MSLREPSIAADASRPRSRSSFVNASRPASITTTTTNTNPAPRPRTTTNALRHAVKSISKFTGHGAHGDAESRSMFLKECSLYTCFLLAGWVDATPGALLPAIRQRWDLSFVYVSMLFVGTFTGCIIAAGFVSPMMDRFGFGKMISGAAALGLVFPVVFLTMPPFPVLIVAMIFSGMSTSTLDALVNVWISQRPKADVRLGFTHFLYGVGALSSPLAAIPFLHEGRKGIAFQYFFVVSLGLATVVLTLVTVAFRLQRDEHVEGPEVGDVTDTSIELQPRSVSDSKEKDVRNGGDAGFSQTGEAGSSSTPLELMPTTSRGLGRSELHPIPSGTANPRSAFHKLKAVVRQRKVILLSMFTFTYVGTEVTVGGWSSTFLLEIRNQSTSANAIVSGFWAGIAFGRILLIPVTAWMGEELAVLVYLFCAIGLQLLVWLLPNIVANAVALALLGVFLGPAFPAMIRVCERTVRPRAHLTAAISFISTFAAAGMAMLPLLVGIASQEAPQGIKILAPMLVAMLAVQVGLWCATNQRYLVKRVLRRQGDEQQEIEDVDRLD
ncbi:Bypass of stop codon protein 6 [Pseudozyma hubeiensis]|nr:Bypass of stop codon protein 6 [Pseudozyma hubeiensis]